MTKKKVLVVCVDRDNDLGEKAGIAGPVIGRSANLEAAAKLALADPEEPDANTMFEAVRILDKLPSEEAGQVVTLTGSRKLGYEADRLISGQLDMVLREYAADYAVVVSDGASDDETLPIIQSRIKINSTKIVVMKQAKELEKTYFVLLEKLKEPYYQRLVWGVPGILLMTIVLAFLFAGADAWRLIGFLLGAYLIAKGFGIEDRVLSSVAGFRISVERIGFILYLIAATLLLISLLLGAQEYSARSLSLHDPVKIAAYAIRSALQLFPWAALFVLSGKVVDLLQEKRKYEVVTFGMYSVSVLILWMIFTVASEWVVADAYFSDFVLTIVAGVLLSAISITVAKEIRMNIVTSMKLEGKEVLNQIGAYVGKIVGVDKRRGMIIVQTGFGQRVNVGLENISNIGEKVFVKY